MRDPLYTTAHGAARSARVVRWATVAILCAACAPTAARSAETAGADSTVLLSLEEVLEGYNANISRAMAAIETLRVEQEMVEPAKDGGEKRALAVLHYNRVDGMSREELSGNLGHPVGEYQLSSLVGPELPSSEYDTLLASVEEMEGRRCYRLSVTAIERDTRHFDGTVWVEVGSLGLVRIIGEVADPPFPVQRIKLDKAFEPTPEGFRLLRRHTGEIDIKLALISRHGMMHIFYTDYAIASSP
ncbi:MAG: hypothetical protein ABIK85_05075 [Candidatus Eisenbacteria bacterium]